MDKSKDEIIELVTKQLEAELDELEQYGVESLSAEIRMNGGQKIQKTAPR